MKNLFIILFVFVFGTFLSSCSKTNKAVDEYCNCASSILTDSLISVEFLDTIHKNCFDSIIIKKYELNKDNEFITGFDSIQSVKDLRKKINSKISENINNILIKYSFQTVPDIMINDARTYLFDGKMFTQILYKMQSLWSGWEEVKRFTGTYKVEVENNGNAYVIISFTGNENDIYKLSKSIKDGYYLKGRRTLWQENK